MLSDREIDELESVIAGSTLQQLPMLLMKAIPLLFSELRVSRAALESHSNDLLRELTSEFANQDPGPSQESDRHGLPKRDVPVSCPGEIQVDPPKARKRSSPRRRRDAGPGQPAEGRPDAGILDPRARAFQGILDSTGGEQQVGGPDEQPCGTGEDEGSEPVDARLTDLPGQTFLPIMEARKHEG